MATKFPPPPYTYDLDGVEALMIPYITDREDLMIAKQYGATYSTTYDAWIIPVRFQEECEEIIRFLRVRGYTVLAAYTRKQAT